MKVPFTMHESEQVVLLLRRHWMHLYPKLLLVVLVALVPPLLLWFGVEAVTDVEGLARTLIIVVGVLWALAWLVRAYFLWYRYEHDVWVLTNQRLVDSLKRHWLHHEMASTDLVDIEDVSVHRNGLLRTMFDYGDVNVQTAAQQPNFILSAVPHPRDVLTTVDASRDEARREYLRPV